MTVYKMIEVVGTSGTGVSDAIRAALQRVSAQVEGEREAPYGELRWFEVKEIRGNLVDCEVGEFQVKLSVASEVPVTTGAERGARRSTGSRQARSTAAQVAAKGGDRRRTDLARGFEKQAGRSRRQ